MSHNLVLLTFLYFIQGLPYGLQTRFLPIYLRVETGASLNRVALFRLLHTPWLCKALWAPAVDHYGSKHMWLMWSIAGLALTCLATSMITPDDSFTILCIAMTIMNICASTQDVAVDSIAIALLSKSELGHGNTAQVVGYKLGSIFGGGMLVWFLDTVGWTGLFLVLTLLYVEGLMFVYLSPVLRNMNSSLKENINTCIKTKVKQNQTDQNITTPSVFISSPYSSEDSDLDFTSVQQTKHVNNDQHLDYPSSTLNVRKQPTKVNAPSILATCDHYVHTDNKTTLNNKSLRKTQNCNENIESSSVNSCKKLCKNAFHKTICYIEDLANVPGTRWMIIYVLLYKWGKKHCISSIFYVKIEKE